MAPLERGFSDKFPLRVDQKLDINIGEERINCRFKLLDLRPNLLGERKAESIQIVFQPSVPVTPTIFI